jgi:pyruvate dehydrogenase E2 component (dihydrolipoamide acetyltransferase)
MAEIIRMPRMSDTMEEGVIVEWHKQEGDSVSPGDVLAEVETDKATMDLESFQEGTLLHIGVKEGPVPVDGVIAVIGEKGEDYKELLEAAKQEAPSKEEEKEVSSSTDNGSDAPAPKPEAAPQPKESSSGEGGRIKASPLARKMAEEKGIDISMLQGTGEGGRIVKRDIEKAEETGAGKYAAAMPSMQLEGPEFRDEPISQMRKTIARRLGESKYSAPHFYLTIELDMDNAIAARKSINESIAPEKISFNDMVVKAAAMALTKHPQVNASWMEDKIRFNNRINIGVAVAVDEGLLVPVIRNANLKGYQQINAEVKELAGKARYRKLSLEEMQGNTFSISNLGMMGIEEFTAIINPPDSCIMAVGSIVKKPVVKEGQIVPGNRMKVTMSCDHRVVDGATGAEFLQTFKNYMESPVRMLV